MASFIIEECKALNGTVRISGAKNSALPIWAAALLTEEECVIRDVPPLTDVSVMLKLLDDFGAETHWQNGVIYVRAKKIIKNEALYDLVGKMRASFLLMGPLLARLGKAKVPLPGGCAIGSRPVELHIKGLLALGADITQEHGYVYGHAKKLKGASIYLDFPSVGATENIMMAAVLADGQTVVQNCANEPEIVDLANFLNAIGADIRGAGTDTIKINGVQKLGGCDHTVIPDRIEAGTFMVAAAISGGNVNLENVVIDHLRPVIAKLKETNIVVKDTENGLNISKAGDMLPLDLKTLPYPGFPTDMQAQFMSMLSLTMGTSVVIETVFENRFMHVGELKRFGADIKIEGRSAVVEGVKKLTGTQVKATDLRAGAALVLAALRSGGQTEICDIYHIERGYHDFDLKLASLGAKIKRID